MTDVDSMPEGEPLQLLKMNMKEKKAEVDEKALEILQSNLRRSGDNPVAVVSVMGAFRTGKSFLLDLFLRFLRYEQKHGSTRGTVDPPARAKGVDFPLPAWMSAAGDTLEGASGRAGGFSSKGGMDSVTEGIWVWSVPFVRTVPVGNGTKKMALILMDTQGAWDGQMTKEQSATIFGLTAVLSSKQIYNVNMQVQEDKVENLNYFMCFAEQALLAATKSVGSGNEIPTDDVAQPFQSLDFLVRDWRNFKADWTVEECTKQMKEHIEKFTDPEKVQEKGAAQKLNTMFQRISCFCMPHPGFEIEAEDWSGDLKEVKQDFMRFADIYVRQVFSEALDVKVLLGQPLSTLSFPLIVRQFVSAFQDAALQTMSFNDAMAQATKLLAQEKAMTTYTKEMDEMLAKNKGGLEEPEFDKKHDSLKKKIKQDFDKVMILDDVDSRASTWSSIEANIDRLHKRYLEDNARRLEQVLASFAGVALLGLCLFAVDRLSDFACDWWLQTCVDLSYLMLLCYLPIFAYIGLQIYKVGKAKGMTSVAMALPELWKEIVKLLATHADTARTLNFKSIYERCYASIVEFTSHALASKAVHDGKKKD